MNDNAFDTSIDGASELTEEELTQVQGGGSPLESLPVWLRERIEKISSVIGPAIVHVRAR